MKKLFEKIFKPKPTIKLEPGETELDYVNLNELKPRKPQTVNKKSPIPSVKKLK